MNAQDSYDQAAREVAALRAQIDELRAFERDYRHRLTAHLDECLATLKGGDSNLPLRVAARRMAEAPDADLLEVLTELAEEERTRFMKALLRVPLPEVTR